MAKGRKRKHGKRTKTGRLSRAGQSRIKPSAWVQAQQDLYGNHYNSALGRAYASGLLGQGNDAKARYDAGRRFAIRYTRTFGGSSYTCALGERTGCNDNFDNERDLRHKAWVFAVSRRLDAAGVNQYFEQLLSILHVDTGPYWLDKLLSDPSAAVGSSQLAAAIEGLDIAAGTNSDSIENKTVDIPLHLCHGGINRN